MRLYYLTAQRWAEKILQEQRFKLSTIHEANDPFELLGASIGAAKARRAYKALHAHWAQSIGMLCTTKSWDNPVMWAHYGDRHRGICLGFDVVDAEIHQVQYEANKLTGLLEHIESGSHLLEEQFRAILTTKFKDWEYEREWRIFASLKNREAQSGLYYLNFAPHFMLREVILGARCPATPEELAGHVKSGSACVEIFKARPAFQSFRIVRQKQIPIITVTSQTTPSERTV
ncbi:DUF2971 domain-containing protein [Burkholderia lata]|nr:DUF2971 domain-containing protein [Burkholderia lata]